MLTMQMRIVTIDNVNARRPSFPDKAPQESAAVPIRRISSAVLMRQQTQLIIEHAGREYLLRITYNGKLILTA